MQNSTALMVQFLVFMFVMMAFFAVLEAICRRRKAASRRGASRG